MTNKEISDLYQKMINEIDLKKILLEISMVDEIPFIPIRTEIEILPADEPKQFKSGWMQRRLTNGSLILEQKQQISHCKRCNIQNEYIDYNPNYLCYSCKS
jgi:hypothetical protein